MWHTSGLFLKDAVVTEKRGLQVPEMEIKILVEVPNASGRSRVDASKHVHLQQSLLISTVITFL